MSCLQMKTYCLAPDTYTINGRFLPKVLLTSYKFSRHGPFCLYKCHEIIVTKSFCHKNRPFQFSTQPAGKSSTDELSELFIGYTYLALRLKIASWYPFNSITFQPADFYRFTNRKKSVQTAQRWQPMTLHFSLYYSLATNLNLAPYHLIYNPVVVRNLLQDVVQEAGHLLSEVSLQLGFHLLQELLCVRVDEQV